MANQYNVGFTIKNGSSTSRGNATVTANSTSEARQKFSDHHPQNGRTTITSVNKKK
ncbi:hypothetical protein [Selenomonas sp. ND2010]|uniref:hypothetical protein n=1 Tax=Selenomonas sp. ND2010 TaxID=1410618 RepID=UPI0012DD2AC5|nr:hypothetical protein [Selenomonas sp. ND2010]